MQVAQPLLEPLRRNYNALPSTCHVVLSKEYYAKTVSNGDPSDEENDLLDLA